MSFLLYCWIIGQQIQQSAQQAVQQAAQQVVTSTTTNNGGLIGTSNSNIDTSTNNVEENESTYQRELNIAIGIILLASLAPPPLKLFPPKGLPQPGIFSAGGGAIPSEILGVGLNN